ncbi:MAG: alkaline phosphatase [Alphaproteobacteria bacterium]|nr:alkaline phosphatase [Alphaproteobacteria bacterium]
MFRRTFTSTFAIALCGGTAFAQDLPQGGSEYFTAAQQVLGERLNAEPNTGTARNVILFVADGMGIGTNYGIRLYMGQQEGLLGEEYNLPYDLFQNSAIMKTYNINAQTPDSAPTAGAMNTGVKQIFNTINMSEDVVHEDCSSGTPLTTFAELASEAGKSVGVVSTARITHATPAAVFAKTQSRDWEGEAPEGCTDIATQMIDAMESGMLDFAMGGGASNFAPEGVDVGGGLTGSRPDDVDLVARAKDLGVAFAHDRETAEGLDLAAEGPVLGLFAGSHMAYAADRPEQEPTLAEMTQMAIEKLSSNEEGFYLEVEAGRVDHGSHDGNAHRTFTDGVAFAEAIQATMEATNPEETLIIVTSDHDHAMVFNGYCGRGTPITGLCYDVSTDRIKHSDELVLADDGSPFTVVGFGNGPGSILTEQEDGTYSGSRAELTQDEATNPDHLQQALIPASSESHSGVDVGLWATGPWAHLFGGTMDQEVIFHVMRQAMFPSAE